MRASEKAMTVASINEMLGVISDRHWDRYLMQRMPDYMLLKLHAKLNSKLNNLQNEKVESNNRE